MLLPFLNRKDKKNKAFFPKNGAALLEQLIHSFNGKCNPIRAYSEEELKKATNDYHYGGMTYEDWNFQLYKGVHEDHEILVKKFDCSRLNRFFDPLELITNEVSIASNMSKHGNALKLLGCCLETELPTLVYEFPEKGNLSHYIYRNSEQLLPWHIKLNIAIKVAEAISHLHHGMSKVIIHRDIKTGHIFLDQDYVAKLSEFQTSLPIPSDAIHVDAEVFGTTGMAAPEVVRYGRYTEKSDVYNLGIVLCEILSGKSMNDLRFFRSSGNSSEWENILKENILHERDMGQVTECSKLALRCLEFDPNERPTMKEVSQALRLIKSFQQ